MAISRARCAYEGSLPRCEPQKTQILFIAMCAWSARMRAPADDDLDLGCGGVCRTRGTCDRARQTVDVRIGHRHVRPDRCRRTARNAQRCRVRIALSLSL